MRPFFGAGEGQEPGLDRQEQERLAKELSGAQERQRQLARQMEYMEERYSRSLEQLHRTGTYLDGLADSAIADGEAGTGVREDDMQYTVLSDHIIGQSHVKMGADCEDCSAHLCDGEGRYAVAVVCDGHSDPKCFRSAVGARLGCETAVEILDAFLAAYCREDPAVAFDNLRAAETETLERLRRAVVSEWNRRVEENLEAHPITEEEYAALDHPQYRAAMELFRAGRARSHIYGATLLAAAVCEDFHLLLHIGDGVAVVLTGDGTYITPLPPDDREEMEGPASLCDGDLLTRELAFRAVIRPGRPQAVFVTSDGVGDMPLSVYLREHLCKLHRELVDRESQSAGPLSELNEAQSSFLHSFIAYFAKAGLEDDCCLAGFYDPRLPVADVRLPRSELQRLSRELQERREEEDRKYRESRERLEQVKAQTDQTVERLERELEDLRARIEALSAARASAEVRTGQVLASLERLQQRHGARSEDLRRQEQTLQTRYGEPEEDPETAG